MKKITLLVSWILTIAGSALGQTNELYVGNGSSVYITTNEILQVNKLTLTPSSGFELTKSITSHTSIINNTSGPSPSYVSIVYAFGGTTSEYSGIIKINHTGANANGIAESNMRLHYHDGSRWNIDASSSSTSSLLTSNLAGKTLNELTIAGSSVVLPLTWLSFTAEKQGDLTLLRWSTAAEQNTKDFEVQFSNNAQSWATLGTVGAAGNSTTPRQYSFTHSTPFRGNVNNYYRIMQRDLDEKFSYSKIVSLIYDKTGPDIFIYPNPAKDVVTIFLVKPQEVKLINVEGAILWKGTLASGNNKIPLTNLARGTYWIVAASLRKQLVVH